MIGGISAIPLFGAVFLLGAVAAGVLGALSLRRGIRGLLGCPTSTAIYLWVLLGVYMEALAVILVLAAYLIFTGSPLVGEDSWRQAGLVAVSVTLVMLAAVTVAIVVADRKASR